MPNTVPGLFISWKLESGVRYRNVLLIADFAEVRGGTFRMTSIKEVHEKEVHFPALTFPFAEARAIALRNLEEHSGALP